MTVDPLKAARGTVGVLGEVLKIAAANPDARQAGGELGRAALTVARTINNALLPLAAVNFAFDKARAYFSDKFEEDLASRVAQVPAEHIVDPKASIAGPALQGLAFAHEEPDLKEMYLNLLGTAMDGRRASAAHPAFVEIIRQLDADEARLLRVVLRADGMPIVEIRRNMTNPSGWRTLQCHLIDFRDDVTKEQAVVPRLTAMVDNWIRLGLLTVDYAKFLVGETRYDWVEGRPEFRRLVAEQQDGTVTFERGVIAPTALGRQFANVVGIVTDPPSS